MMSSTIDSEKKSGISRGKSSKIHLSQNFESGTKNLMNWLISLFALSNYTTDFLRRQIDVKWSKVTKLVIEDSIGI